jgi:BTB/POZ domain
MIAGDEVEARLRLVKIGSSTSIKVEFSGGVTAKHSLDVKVKAVTDREDEENFAVSDWMLEHHELNKRDGTFIDAFSLPGRFVSLLEDPDTDTCTFTFEVHIAPVEVSLKHDIIPGLAHEYGLNEVTDMVADHLPNHYHSMMVEGWGSDVKLLVGSEGVEMKAHKSILAASSPVLEAMFQSGMLEESQNSVVLTDASEEEVRLFLEIIYTGRVFSKADWNNWKTVAGVLSLCDKYSLRYPNVEDMCIARLCSLLLLSNACTILLLAQKLIHSKNMWVLKNAALKYLARNMYDVRDTPEYKELMQTDVALVQDIMDEVLLQAGGKKRRICSSCA